jgi:hypothetical protein
MTLRIWPEFDNSVPPQRLSLLPYLVGATGPSGAAAAKFVHTQASPSVTWTVNHNLGVRPIVALFSVGWVVIEAAIVHVSENQFTVQFNAATSGFAVCQ